MSKKISPWNELDYYKEGQSIYGRDEEIRKISNSICQNLQTILYGQSGIGKSSLLFAGIFPVLRKEQYFPIFIRLGLVSKDDSYTDYIIQSIEEEAKRVDENIKKEKISSERIGFVDSSNQKELKDSDRLWEFFCCTEFKNDAGEAYIPVLVFDQFEEILNNKDTFQKAKQFLLDIYSLLDDTRIQPGNSVPYSNFRIVFSLREDYLYCLEDIIDRHNLTELRFNRFRIKALSHQRAREIILKTANGNIEEGKEQEICNKVIEESQNYMGEVNTLMLSLICSTCYANSSDGVLRLQVLENCEDQLYYYYENKMGVVSVKTKQYLENVLVTNDGRRDSIDTKAAIDSGKVLQEEINALVASRIVRVLSTSEGGKRMEFIHDKITSIINSKKQTYLHCLKNAIRNSVNLNTRAGAKEYCATNVLSIVCGVLLVGTMYLWTAKDSAFTVSLLLIFYYVFIFSWYLSFTTAIRRSHDRNKSGWSGMWDFMKNAQATSSSKMYSNGTSTTIALLRMHPHNTLSRKEYIALHKFNIFTLFWLVIILLPLFFILLLKNEFYAYIGVSYIAVCLILSLWILPFRRLPAMNISACFGLVPIVPWVMCFFEKKDEKYYELDDGKALKRGLIIYFILSCFFTFLYSNWWPNFKEGHSAIFTSETNADDNDIEFQACSFNREAYEYAIKNDFKTAYVKIDSAISICPKETDYYVTKGEFYIMQDSIDQALYMWEKAIEIEPDYLDINPTKSTLYLNLRKRGLVK